MFKIDFNRLVAILTPGVLRRPRLLALMRTFLFPLAQLHNNFLAFRDKNIYTLTHNSQVYSMENVANDRFDKADRRIYITDGFARERVYLYTRLEARPIFLGTLPLYNRADYADTGVDFIVWVPNAVFISPQDKIELTALMNKYKLTSKRFKIYRV